MWLGSVVVRVTTNRSRVLLPAITLPGSDPGQVVHTHVPSASKVTTVWRHGNLINFKLIKLIIITGVAVNIGSAADRKACEKIVFELPLKGARVRAPLEQFTSGALKRTGHL